MAVLRRTLEFLNIDGSDVSAAEEMTYFRWQHGLLYGEPVKKLFLPWPVTPSMPETISYRSRRLCYRMKNAREVELLNLESGEKLIWTGSERLVNDHWDLRVSDRYAVIIAGRYANTTPALSLSAAFISQSHRQISDRVGYAHTTSIRKRASFFGPSYFHRE